MVLASKHLVTGGQRLRMSAPDAAWRVADHPTNPMVVTGVLQFRGKLDLESVQALIQQRMIDRHPEFSYRFHLRGNRIPQWEPVFCDVREQVVEQHLPAAHLPGSLQLAVNQALAQPLATDRPPWIFHLVHEPNGRSTLIAQFHHSLSDGIALARVLLGLHDTPAPEAARAAISASTPRRQVPGKLRVLQAMASTAIRLGLRPKEPASPVRCEPGTTKSVAWGSLPDLAIFREAARAQQVSVNDLLLAATAGGIRALSLSTGHVPRKLRILVPADLRGAQPSHTLGNRLGLLFVTLPVHLADRAARIQAIARQTRRQKSGATAAATFGFLHLVGAFPRAIAPRAVRLLGNSASAVVTNVPGPRHPLQLGGIDLETVAFWVPQVGRITLGVSLFSYAGGITLGISCDANLAISPAELAAAISSEATTICAP